MTDDERAARIRALLWDHAHPTLRRMERDRIGQLAEQILRVTIDRGLWSKWEQNREELAERAACVWVPFDDLQGALNTLPGPKLTSVDVEQRIREIREKPYGSYPNQELAAEALAIFAGACRRISGRRDEPESQQKPRVSLRPHPTLPQRR